MRKVSLILLLAFTMVAMMAMFANAADAVYVGAKKCKGCHKTQHASWGETAHANAFGLLSAEEQKDPKCVGCHTTGTDKTGAVLEGIQCEACHGAGSGYKSAKIMSKKKWKADPEGQLKLAVEAGLLTPTVETCKKCHTAEGNANFKEFKFEEAKGKVHPEAVEAEAKK